MNILYITHCDPRRTDFGSAQRTHWLWQALKSVGAVYTVYDVGPGESLVKDDEARIASWHLSPRSWLLRHLQAWFGQLASPAAWSVRNKNFVRGQMPWRDVKFDLVVVRYLASVAYSNAWQFGPVYVDIDDLPIEAYETIYSRRHRWPMTVLWRWVVMCWQKSILKRCRAAWIANAAQVELVSKTIPCSVLSNLAQPPQAGYRINGRQKQQLMTVGLMSYEPNYQGVDWFVNSIWPEIRQAFPQMTYAIAGGGCPESYRDKWSRIEGVKVLGFVKDIDALYEESLAVVAPILSGAGTCIKVIEGALRGRMVFASKFALRGYEDIGADLMIMMVEDSSKMVERLRQILTASAVERQVKIKEAAGRLCSHERHLSAVVELIRKV